MKLSKIRELLKLPDKISPFIYFRLKGPREESEIDRNDEDKYFGTDIFF
jgi:hypothetical protein